MKVLVTTGDISLIEDKEELMDLFEDIDNEVLKIKWDIAKVWLFNSIDDLTDEQQLMVAGLI